MPSPCKEVFVPHLLTAFKEYMEGFVPMAGTEQEPNAEALPGDVLGGIPTAQIPLNQRIIKKLEDEISRLSVKEAPEPRINQAGDLILPRLFP